MKEFETDILIVGAGLTGLLTASALSALNVKIYLVDIGNFSKKENYVNDFRTTAVSEGSKIFFEKLKLWKKIEKHAQKIKHIKVIDRNSISKIDFKNPQNNGNLGYVVKNSIIKKILLDFINSKTNVIIKENAKLKDINIFPQSIKAHFDNFQLCSRLLIGSDGKKSFVRSKMKTLLFTKKYEHAAAVLNFSHKKNHQNIAHEIFLDSGPLAILPMKSNIKGVFNTSMIWSHNKDFAHSLVKIKTEIQKKILEEQVKEYTGDIIKIFDAKVFNLSAHINNKFYEERVVYLGDSAHSIHPIAGQGWNLGVRDVYNLFNILENSILSGLDIGSNYVCKKYHDKSYHDSFIMYQITDKLNSIFLDKKLITSMLRANGFSIINNNKAIKDKITSFAMGV